MPESAPHPLSVWTALVREGLAGRRKAVTPAEERRVAKTLERIQPAANVALAGAAAVSARSGTPDFSSVLAQLSDA